VLFGSLEFLVLLLPLTLAVSFRLDGQPLLRWIAVASVVNPMLLTTGMILRGCAE
jgi:hypothetical protein